MKKYCFGVDLGGTTVKIGFFDTDGKMLEKWEIPTRKEEGGSLILKDSAEPAVCLRIWSAALESVCRAP